MSFDKYRDNKYGDIVEKSRVMAMQILEESYFLRDEDDIKNGRAKDRLDNLGRMIVQCLDGNPDEISDEIARAIELAAERVIDAMGDQRGIIHTGLCHLAQIEEDPSIYDPRIKERLDAKFNESSWGAYLFSQFLDFHQDGKITLNSWGDLIADRLTENQILQRMDMDGGENGNVRRIYNHLVPNL